MSKKNIEKILIVSKMTELEFEEMRYGDAVEQLYKSRKKDFKKAQEEHELHYEGLEQVMKAFTNNGLSPGLIKKQAIGKSDFKDKWDLIVPVGGDGTFMDSARYIMDDTPIFGIKSGPTSVGGHYNTNFTNAEENIKKILDGDYSIKKRTRVKGKIKNEFNLTDHAMNEIYIGDYAAAGFAYVDVYLNGKKFETGGSGIVASTYKGKTGWFDNIFVPEMNPKKVQEYKEAHIAKGLKNVPVACWDSMFQEGEENIIRYKIREPGKMINENYGYTHGILRPGEEIRVVSWVLIDGTASFDGNKKHMIRPRSYNLEYGNEVVISVSDKPLSVVEFE